MSKLSLSARVNAFGKANAKAGNVALSLTVETMQHAIATGDGTLVIRLLGKLEAAQEKVAASLVKKSGFTLVKDTKAGAWKINTKADAIAKVKADNAGMSFLADVDALAAKGAVLLGKEVKALIEGEGKAKPAPKNLGDTIMASVTSRVKAGTMTLDQAIAELESTLAALKAKGGDVAH